MDLRDNEHLADLGSIANGAAGEKFEAELRRVLANIRDPNTEAKAKRKIILEFTFLPDENREVVHAVVASRASLPASKPTGATMFVGSFAGKPVATVLTHAGPGDHPGQGILPIDRDSKKAGEQ